MWHDSVLYVVQSVSNSLLGEKVRDQAVALPVHYNSDTRINILICEEKLCVDL